jgi:hypothetical protein
VLDKAVVSYRTLLVLGHECGYILPFSHFFFVILLLLLLLVADDDLMKSLLDAL